MTKVVNNSLRTTRSNDSDKVPSSWQKKFFLWTFFAILAGIAGTLTYVYVFRDLNIARSFSQIASSSHWAILFPLLAFLIYKLTVMAVIPYIFLRSRYPQIKYWKFIPLGLQMTLISSITPFGTGSEPWTLYVLKRQGFYMRDCIPALLVRNFINQIMLLFFVFLTTPYGLVSSFSFIWKTTPLLIVFLGIGNILDIFMALIYFFSGWSKRCQNWFLKIILGITKHVWFLKKYEPQIHNHFRTVQECTANFHYYLVSWKACLVAIILLVFYIWYYLEMNLSIFLLMSQDQKNLSFSENFQVMGLTAAAVSANNFFPIPGGEGSTQLLLQNSLKIIFNNQINSSELADNSIFQWRFFSFYLPVLISFLGIPFMIFVKKRNLLSRK